MLYYPSSPILLLIAKGTDTDKAIKNLSRTQNIHMQLYVHVTLRMTNPIAPIFFKCWIEKMCLTFKYPSA